jgi:hypothetical protein
MEENESTAVSPITADRIADLPVRSANDADNEFTTTAAATYLEFVQDGCLACRVETHHEYSVLLIAKEQTVKAVIHGGEGTTHLSVVCLCTVLSFQLLVLCYSNGTDGHYRDRSMQLCSGIWYTWD